MEPVWHHVSSTSGDDGSEQPTLLDRREADQLRDGTGVDGFVSVMQTVPWGEESSRHIPVLILNYIGSVFPHAGLVCTCSTVYDWYYMIDLLRLRVEAGPSWYYADSRVESNASASQPSPPTAQADGGETSLLIATMSNRTSRQSLAQ